LTINCSPLAEITPDVTLNEGKSPGYGGVSRHTAVCGCDEHPPNVGWTVKNPWQAHLPLVEIS